MKIREEKDYKRLEDKEFYSRSKSMIIPLSPNLSVSIQQGERFRTGTFEGLFLEVGDSGMDIYDNVAMTVTRYRAVSKATD